MVFNMTLTDFKGIVVLLSFAVITAFVYNQFSPHGIELFGQWDAQKGVVRAISKSDDLLPSIEIHDPNIIQTIIKTKSRIIIDVRHRDIYDQGHLPGALSFPIIDFDQNIRQIITTIKRKEPLLIYCSSSECSDSHSFAAHLINLKYTDVKIFSGGFRTWEEDGRKIEKNEN